MVVGLTGGIGSGKTTVLSMLESLGAKVFVADVEAKKIMNTDAHLKSEILNLFGDEAYENGQLNRKFIASAVFNNAQKLAALNALVHPKVKQAFLKFKAPFAHEIVIYEAAILFESGSAQLCDYIITVTATLQDRILRVMQRDTVTAEEIKSRMQHQLNDNVKVLKANFVIQNNKLTHTKHQVNTMYELLLKLKKII
jgi:dephospho-CoA kinase